MGWRAHSQCGGELDVLLNAHDEAHITLSIGVSLYLPGMTLDKAIAMTDEALYEAKRSGKIGW